MALRRRYALADYPDLLRDVKAGMQKAGKRGLYSAALRLSTHIQTVIIPQTTPQPVDRGVYKAGWGAQSVEKTPDGAEIYNTTPTAAHIEHGVKNVKIGRAMIQALAEWAKRKGVASGDADSLSVAWAIAKRLQQTGIFRQGQGLQVFARAALELPRFIREEVKRELEKELKK